ncbi:unnamed protein product [Staurois parvus]|uniref:Uncharacterized protein n=1 Tax=Staurois parvus TaxID=386267 RepID=A0ABN9FPU6_9NEOB|nr:unnamed protein product [Staurois parvus]
MGKQRCVKVSSFGALSHFIVPRRTSPVVPAVGVWTVRCRRRVHTRCRRFISTRVTSAGP